MHFSKSKCLCIIIMGIMLRLPSIIKYGYVLHEFDPYFNLKVTKYLVENGIRKFYTWKDEKVWYPYGREIMKTCYPGMMIYTYLIHKLLSLFHIKMKVNTLCVLFPLLGSLFTFFGVYKLASIISRNGDIAILSMFLLATTPSFLSRSMAGFFDYECVSVGLILFSFYYYLKCLDNLNVANFAKLIFFYFNLALTWGGYVYVTTLIALHSLLFILINSFVQFKKKSALLRRYTPVLEIEGDDKAAHNKTYILLYIIGNSLLYCIPVIGKKAFISEEQLLPLITFLVHLVSIKEVRIPFLFILPLFLIFFPKSIERGKLIDLILFKRKKSALVESISEHNPRNFFYFLLDLHILIMFLPNSLKYIFSFEFEKSIFMILYLFTSVFCSTKMLRLLIPASPCFCIAAAFPISKLLYQVRSTNSNILAKISVLLMGFLYIMNSVFLSIGFYSVPHIILEANNGTVVNDFQEANAWLKENIVKDKTILAWWDYGYQINALTNLTTFSDNNTSRWDRVALVAKILLSNETEAYKLCVDNNVDYIYIVSGVYTGYQNDYIGKSYWMGKIAREHGFSGYSDKESILYQMCYCNNPDNMDKINYLPYKQKTFSLFENVHNSKNHVVKIFKVNKIV